MRFPEFPEEEQGNKSFIRDRHGYGPRSDGDAYWYRPAPFAHPSVHLSFHPSARSCLPQYPDGMISWPGRNGAVRDLGLLSM